MRENTFQAALIKELHLMFPGCMVLKNDANYIQGIPDLLILFENRWAALEVKAGNTKARYEANQEYYIQKLNEMSYATTITPQNREQVLDELQFALQS